MFRAMVQISIQLQNTMRENGTQTNVVDGAECIIVMVLCMKENGLMI